MLGMEVKMPVPPPKKTRFWHAYLERPSKICFGTQVEKEEIILLLRRHWVTNIPWILLSLILLIFPPLLGLLLAFFNLSLEGFLPSSYLAPATFFWYLLTFGYLFQNFLVWYFNVNIVTNERILDIDFYSLLQRDISDCHLLKIQDVTTRMYGFIRTLFHYGDVDIQTAAERREFHFQGVPEPEKVRQILAEEIRKEEAEAPGVVA